MREFESRSEGKFFASLINRVQKVRWARDPRLRVYIGKERKEQGEADIVFTRRKGRRRLDVALVLSGMQLMVGNIRLSDGLKAYRGGLAFDAQGRISNVSEGIQSEVNGIKKIDVLGLLHSMMDSDILDKPIILRGILLKAQEK